MYEKWLNVHWVKYYVYELCAGYFFYDKTLDVHNDMFCAVIYEDSTDMHIWDSKGKLLFQYCDICRF